MGLLEKIFKHRNNRDDSTEDRFRMDESKYSHRDVVGKHSRMRRYERDAIVASSAISDNFGFKHTEANEREHGFILYFSGNAYRTTSHVLDSMGTNRNDYTKEYYVILGNESGYRVDNDNNSVSFDKANFNADNVYVFDSSGKPPKNGRSADDFLYGIENIVREVVNAANEDDGEEVSVGSKLVIDDSEIGPLMYGDREIASIHRLTLVVVVAYKDMQESEDDSWIKNSKNFDTVTLTKPKTNIGTSETDMEDFKKLYCFPTASGELSLQGICTNLCRDIYKRRFVAKYIDVNDLENNSLVVTPAQFVTDVLGLDYVKKVLGVRNQAQNFAGTSKFFFCHSFNADALNDTRTVVCVSFLTKDLIVFPPELVQIIQDLGKHPGIVTVGQYLDSVGIGNIGDIANRPQYIASVLNSGDIDRIFTLNDSHGKITSFGDVDESKIRQFVSKEYNTVKEELSMEDLNMRDSLPKGEYTVDFSIFSNSQNVSESLMYLDENNFDYDIRKYSPKLGFARKFWNEIVKAKKKDDFFNYVAHNDYTVTSDSDVDRLLFGFENEIRANIGLPYEIDVGISEVTKNDSK